MDVNLIQMPIIQKWTFRFVWLTFCPSRVWLYFASEKIDYIFAYEHGRYIDAIASISMK